MFACLYGSGDLTALACEFSPVVERSAPGAVTLDTTGLDRLFGFPQNIAAAIARRAAEYGLDIRIAIAANPDAAIRAARGIEGISIVPQGDEAKFLSMLPVTLLDPSPELRETLDRWGIHRFRDLALLPPLGIAERLGVEGLRLRELALGQTVRKLIPIEDPIRFESELDLEYPVELLESLAFMLARLLNGLATRLATRALATNELHLRLKLENRTTHESRLRFPVPSLDTKAFLKLLHLDLEAHPPAAAVIHVWMGANPVKPQAAQSGLFAPLAPEPVALKLTIERVKAITGEDRVGSPELLDTHRPGAFRMTEFTGGRGKGAACVTKTSPIQLALRRFRPPLQAQVSLAAEHPCFVAAKNIRGKVQDHAGPWRMSGDWWTTYSWWREEWDIALAGGELYRLYREPGGWFVEGSYD